LTRKEINLFFKNIRKTRFAGGKFVSVRYTKGANNTAFIVSGPKKSAAPRNLVRRRISEIVRNSNVIIPRGTDVVFFLKLGQDKKVPNYQDLKKDIKYVVSKISI